MDLISAVVEFFNPGTQKKYDSCLQRFDNAYDEVIKVLPEHTVEELIKSLPDKRNNGV